MSIVHLTVYSILAYLSTHTPHHLFDMLYCGAKQLNLLRGKKRSSGNAPHEAAQGY